MSVATRPHPFSRQVIESGERFLSRHEREALAFHRANPQVYTELVKLARQGIRAGAKKLGIGQLFEVLRWNHLLRTNSADDFKLNNNYRAYYARLMMAREPDLAGIFEIREIRS